MSASLGEQIERRLSAQVVTEFGAMPWRTIRKSKRQVKRELHRRERRRATSEPECSPQYRRYCGHEW